MAFEKLSECFKAFIIAILCSNPILKGTYITVLTSTITALQLEITLIQLQLNRLKVFSTFLGLQLQTTQALIDKVGADLNLLFEPFAAANDCVQVRNINELLQRAGINTVFAATQKLLFKVNRVENFILAQEAALTSKQFLADVLQESIDFINDVCP